MSTQEAPIAQAGVAPTTTKAARSRLRAALIHLALSALLAASIAALVFACWYPMPYREAAGGRELFLLVVAVDVVLGPLITFAVFNPRKPWKELRLDLTVIGLIQLAGLGYGLYTVEKARPAVVALERDRLRVVRSIDLRDEDFAQAPPGLDHRSWLGPLEAATRAPRADEAFDAIKQGLAGNDIGARPTFWLPPEQTAKAWGEGARPIALLRQLQPQRAAVIDAAVAATGRPEATLGYLPIIARRNDFVLLVDKASGQAVGYAQVDGHR